LMGTVSLPLAFTGTTPSLRAVALGPAEEAAPATTRSYPVDGSEMQVHAAGSWLV
jgi:hypothetical protein